MAGIPVASNPAKWIPGFELKAFTSTPVASYLFDWNNMGGNWTALRFVVVNEGAGELTVTPECSYDGIHVEQGREAPLAFTVAAGYSYGDPYGIDEMRPYWRLSVSGDSSGKWGLLGIPR
jgi:hypothetical protein